LFATAADEIGIQLVIIVARAGRVPGKQVPARDELHLPVRPEGREVAEERAELDIAPLVGIDLRVRREHSGQQSGARQIVDIELQRRVIVAARDAPDEVIAGQIERPAKRLGADRHRGAHEQRGGECRGAACAARA